MKIPIPFYNSTLYLLSLMMALVCFFGCDSRQDRMWRRLAYSEASPLQQVLHANLDAIGGRATWQGIEAVDAEVVATLFETDRSRTLVDMSQVLTFDPYPSLTLDCRLPTGDWIERLDSNGGVSVDAAKDNPAPEEEIETVYGAGLKLRLLIQALTQSVGLLNDEWTLGYLGQERKGGRLSHKVEVSGLMIRAAHDKDAVGQMNRLVIWFDADTNLIDRLWLQYDKGPRDQTGYIAANVGQYKKQSNGVVLPTYIGVVRSDAFQQFSEQEILRLEYQKLRFR